MFWNQFPNGTLNLHSPFQSNYAPTCDLQRTGLLLEHPVVTFRGILMCVFGAKGHSYLVPKGIPILTAHFNHVLLDFSKRKCSVCMQLPVYFRLQCISHYVTIAKCYIPVGQLVPCPCMHICFQDETI